jgi:hypothetical protein
MKSIIRLCSIALLFFMVGARLAHAELDQTLVASIPFDFYAGNQQMPAGTYNIKFDVGSSLVLVSDRAGHHAGFLLGTRENDGNNANSELVFDHTGDEYFLKDMKSSNLEMSFHIKRADNSAALTSPSTQVEVAMNR